MLVLGLLSVFLSSVIATEVTRKEVTIDAAFRYKSDLYLISGDHFMAVSKKGYERYVKQRDGSTGVPTAEHLVAAVTWPKKPLVYFYGPNLSYKNDQSSLLSKIRKYGPKRVFLKDGGPDAAAYRRGTFYIFRGCQFVAQRATLWLLGKPKEVQTLGLPCYPDAAWTDPDLKGMTVLKGNQIWMWRNKVTGPVPFDSKYHIFSWQLKHVPDDTFQV